MAKKINVIQSWAGMSCRICGSGILDQAGNVAGCDHDLEARNDGYCAIFNVHEGRVKTKKDMAYYMRMHVQRWIKERIERGQIEVE